MLVAQEERDAVVEHCYEKCKKRTNCIVDCCGKRAQGKKGLQLLIVVGKGCEKKEATLC